VITDANGLPLAAQLSSANTNDISQLQSLVEAIPPVRGKRGRPRRRPECVQGDKAYDSNAHRAWLRHRRIQPVLGRRRAPHGSGLGRYRWVVERTLAWLHQFKRLRTRYERRDDIHEAFLALGCAFICWRTVKRSLC
jgi:transposase